MPTDSRRPPLRRITALGTLAFLAGSLCAACVPLAEPVGAAEPAVRSPSAPRASREALVRLRQGTGPEALEDLKRETGTELIRRLPDAGVLLMRLPEGLPAAEALERLRQRPEVEDVEPNFTRSIKEN